MDEKNMRQLKRKSIRKNMDSKNSIQEDTPPSSDIPKDMESSDTEESSDTKLGEDINTEEICREMYSIYQNIVIGYILLKDTLKSVDNVKSIIENIEKEKEEEEERNKQEKEEEKEEESSPQPSKKIKVSCGFESVRIEDREILNDFASATKHLLSYSDLLGKAAFKLLFNEKMIELYHESPKIMENINKMKENMKFGFNKNDIDFYSNDIIKFLNQENII